MMQIKMDAKVSFTDQLGVIGGNLGLFTGVSILSVVEVVFWLYKEIIPFSYTIMCALIIDLALFQVIIEFASNICCRKGN